MIAQKGDYRVSIAPLGSWQPRCISGHRSRGVPRGSIARRTPHPSEVGAALFRSVRVCAIRLKMKELTFFWPSLDGHREFSLPTRFRLDYPAFPCAEPRLIDRKSVGEGKSA